MNEVWEDVGPPVTQKRTRQLQQEQGSSRVEIVEQDEQQQQQQASEFLDEQKRELEV